MIFLQCYLPSQPKETKHALRSSGVGSSHRTSHDFVAGGAVRQRRTEVRRTAGACAAPRRRILLQRRDRRARRESVRRVQDSRGSRREPIDRDGGGVQQAPRCVRLGSQHLQSARAVGGARMERREPGRGELPQRRGVFPRWGNGGVGRARGPRAARSVERPRSDRSVRTRLTDRSAAASRRTPGLLFAVEAAMSLTGLIWFLLIGLIAGWLAGQVMRGGGYGVVGDMIVGVIGALIGGWLFGVLHIGIGGLLGAIITAFVGAIILIALLRIIRRA